MRRTADPRSSGMCPMRRSMLSEKVLRGTVACVLSLAAVHQNVSAQSLRAPTAWAGVNFITGLPVGEFKDYINAGFGGGANGVLPIKRESPLALRADIGFLVYGSETKRVCFSNTVGCRVMLDVTTTNSIFFANV